MTDDRELPGDASPDRLAFDSTDRSPDEAFARYRDLYGMGTDAFLIGDDFHAVVEAWRLDRTLLYDRHLNDVGHRRDAQRTRADGVDHFTVTLLLDGALEVDGEDGLSVRLQPGEVLLIDTHMPVANRMRHAHLVTMAIARERIAAIAGDVDGLHGLVLTNIEARLLREFVESLLRNLPTMRHAATMTAAGVLTTLLMIAIDNSGVERRGVASPLHVERLGQVKRLIAERAADPAFGIAEAVEESGLSRATLYRLLGPEGGLKIMIRNRRLETVRRQLGDPTETRPFAQLAEAAGFATGSHASRSFVERYGVRPGDYRDIVQAGTGADAFFKMRFWQEELR